MTKESIAIIGAGAWGTALAITIARKGESVRLWAREPGYAETMAQERRNPVYLPEHPLPEGVFPTGTETCVVDADPVLLVTPAQHIRAACRRFAAHIGRDTSVVICAKGIEQDTGARLSAVVEEELPGRPVLVLSGPTFASEVAAGLPAAATLAGRDSARTAEVADRLGSRTFRLYHSGDVAGVEIGGAVKNVVAIAAGIVQGRRLGENARAALVTRSLAEIGRLAAAEGGRRETLMGLAGLGDLVLTCGGLQSRNFSLGIALGEGRTLAEVLRERRSVSEGVFTARAASGLARRRGVDMPITFAVDAVLHEGADLDVTIDGLLARPFRAELA